MGHMIIDGRKVEFTDEKNVLSVIRKAGINIPTLCYHSEVSTFGACRLCTVEDERGKTFASCSEQPRDGMVIYTNSGRVKKYRKLIVELLLAAHVLRVVSVSFRNWHTGWAYRQSVSKIPGNIMSWIQVLLLWFVIQTNVFCVVTAYVPAKNFRESEL